MRREIVLAVAVVLAAASCIAVPPDAAYSSYIDWHTLALLFCLMAVVAGLRSLGVLDSMGEVARLAGEVPARNRVRACGNRFLRKHGGDE